MHPGSLYNDSLSLLTDLYQLTMAYGYWKTGMHEREAVFHLYFRKNPFRGNYTITAGLEQAIEYINQFQFRKDDLDYLSTLVGNDDQLLFHPDFIDYLSTHQLTCDVDAIPEGTIVFPNEPLIRVKGKLIDCQLLETPLLNIMNFQSLIATKSSRVCKAAEGEPVIEFGLRRAQGPDGGISASRAAYIGGCAATSNVLAGKLFGIPVRGTHAHSWVMAFPTEQEAFQKYAEALPNNCIFLVDTYDTIEGVKRAIETGKYLNRIGKTLAGIRLDSGDMTKDSIQARKLLDAAGFYDTQIVGSNDLDEYKIAKMKRGGAKVNVWGIGTHMVTAYDQPALGGVYKLGAIKDKFGKWQYRIKISSDPEKVTTPGILNVKRFIQNGKWKADLLFDETMGCEKLSPEILIDAKAEILLVPVARNGKPVYALPAISDIRKNCLEQVESFLASSQNGTVSLILEPHLSALKSSLISKAKQL